ncbi:ATP-binding protein [Ancylobacter sonchi]|uniref:ATP-binding protein n=1 Tax=Ancylobacter sonchi TaxID=1937790 RepID=UPI0028ABFF0A|nr:ATP-binding protein [Ancylobacter sonchi]
MTPSAGPSPRKDGHECAVRVQVRHPPSTAFGTISSVTERRAALEALDHLVCGLEQGELSALGAIDILPSEELTLPLVPSAKGACRNGSASAAGPVSCLSTRSATGHRRRGHPPLQLVNTRYERGAMIPAFSRGFVQRGNVLGDPVVATALLDRLLHHAAVVQIEDLAIACASTPNSCLSMLAQRSTSRGPASHRFPGRVAGHREFPTSPRCPG